MGINISGKGILSGVASLIAGVASGIKLLASKVLGYSSISGGGSSYYATTMIESKDPGFLSLIPYTNKIAKKTDKMSAAQYATMPRPNYHSLVYGNGYYVAVHNDGYYAYSTDGISWTEEILLPEVTNGTGYINAFFINERFLLSRGDAILAGFDPNSLTKRLDIFTNGDVILRAEAGPHNENMYIIGNTTIHTFNITYNVRQTTHTFNNNISDIKFFDNKLIVNVYQSGPVYTSISELGVPFDGNGASFSSLSISGIDYTGKSVKVLTNSSVMLVLIFQNGSAPYLYRFTDISTYSDITSSFFPTSGSGYQYSQIQPDRVGVIGNYFIIYTNSEFLNNGTYTTESKTGRSTDGLNWTYTIDTPTESFNLIDLGFLHYKNAPIEINGKLLASRYDGSTMVTGLFSLFSSTFTPIDTSLTLSNNPVDAYIIGPTVYIQLSDSNKKYIYTSDINTLTSFTLYAEIEDNYYHKVVYSPSLISYKEVQAAIGNQADQGAETLAPVDVYTVPAGKTTLIDRVTIRNTSDNTITYDLGLFGQGYVLDDNTAFLNDQPILAGETATLTGQYLTNNSPLSSGQRIVVLPSSVDTVEVKVYGTETNA